MFKQGPIKRAKPQLNQEETIKNLRYHMGNNKKKVIVDLNRPLNARHHPSGQTCQDTSGNKNSYNSLTLGTNSTFRNVRKTNLATDYEN